MRHKITIEQRWLLVNYCYIWKDIQWSFLIFLDPVSQVCCHIQYSLNSFTRPQSVKNSSKHAISEISSFTYLGLAFGKRPGCLFLIHMSLVLFYGHQHQDLCHLVLTRHQIICSELPCNRTPGFQDRKPRNCHCFKRVAQNSCKHTPEIAWILRKENDTLTLGEKIGLCTQQRETCTRLPLHQFAADQTT